MMTAECNEQREERVFRKDKGKCAFSTNTGSLFQRYTFCSYFYSFRCWIDRCADKLDMVSRISFVHGIHLDPAIGNVLIIILIQEHLAAERFDTEITTLITAPRVRILIARRKRNAQTGFIFRKTYIFMSDSTGTFQIISGTCIHFLGTVTRTGIAEKHITDFFHCLWSSFRKL